MPFEKVDVADVLSTAIIPDISAEPETESSLPGDVDPMPTNPNPFIRMASVNAPPCSVEKVIELEAVFQFRSRKDSIAAVVVALV